jgi:hypothetical protein
MLFFKTAKTTLQGFWEKITASDLGTGSSGAGTKYLADDMTWKPLSGGSSGGPGGVLDGGNRLVGNAYFDGGPRV